MKTLLIGVLFMLLAGSISYADDCQVAVIIGEKGTQMCVACNGNEPMILDSCDKKLIRIENYQQEVIVCCDNAPYPDKFCMGVYLPSDKEKI